jgi:hypothetical protein
VEFIPAAARHDREFDLVARAHLRDALPPR